MARTNGKEMALVPQITSFYQRELDMIIIVSGKHFSYHFHVPCHFLRNKVTFRVLVPVFPRGALRIHARVKIGACVASVVAPGSSAVDGRAYEAFEKGPTSL